MPNRQMATPCKNSCEVYRKRKYLIYEIFSKYGILCNQYHCTVVYILIIYIYI